MLFFAVMVLGPGLIALAGFVLSDRIDWRCFAITLTLLAIVAGSSSAIVSCANTHDVEVWNGRVVDKKKVMVSCSHSYQCNCHEVCSGSGNNKSCSTHCDTCYEHSYDYDWDVFTSNSETISIDRVDRQGNYEPPRWSQTKLSEPTAVTHSYVNYVKAAPGTLFKREGNEGPYAATIPKYPQEVYDYYRLDRLVTVGMSLADAKPWRDQLENLNADIGSAKQTNVILVLAKDLPREWYYALEQAWIGGKKNDVILVVGTDSELNVRWVEVMAWESEQLFKVKLRDAILETKTIEREKLFSSVRDNVIRYHKRKPMKDYEYLSSSIVPSTTQWIVSLIIAILLSGGLTIFFHAQDPFCVEGYRSSYRRRSYGYGTFSGGRF